MPDTIQAAPEQAQISQPLTETGESILQSIFSAPVKPSEVKAGTDFKELKKELGDKFQEGEQKTEEKAPEKTPEEEEKEFTKQFTKKDDDTEVIEPKDDPKKEEPKKEEPKTEEKPEDDEQEATGKIKNVQDARKFYKQAKKEKKEMGEKLTSAEKELKEAREKLEKLENAPKPDQSKIEAQEKEVAELRAEREHVKQQAEALEQRAAAYNIQETEPYKRLVLKPLEAMGADLEDLASSVSDEKDDQNAFMSAVGRALSIEDPKARRKAIEEVAAPLTTIQQAELISLDKSHRRVMGDKAKLLGDSQNALKIIKEKQEMDRRDWISKNTNEFKAGALEARAEMKKMYKFFERTDLPEDIKSEIQQLEEAVEKIDPSQLPAKEVGKITEAYYRGQILNKAASKHIAHMEAQEKKFRADLEAAQKRIEELEKAQGVAKSKEEAVDGTRPNLDTGNTNTTEPPRIDTIEGMVSNLFKV